MRRAGKESIIGGLLVLSMILVGAGCAYQMDTLSVTTGATTGDFGMTFADLGLYAQYGNKMTPDGWSIIDGIGDEVYVNDTFFMRATTDYNKIARDYSIDVYKERQKGYNSVEFSVGLEKPEIVAKSVGPYNAINTKGSHQINITVNQMCPGYAQAFHTDVLNVGSVAAKLSDLKFNVKGLEDSGRAADMLDIALCMNDEQHHLTIDKGEPVFRFVNSLAEEGDYFTVDGVDFIKLSALKKLLNEGVRKVIMNATILCNPATDDRVDLFLAVAMNPDAEGTYTTGSTTVLAKNDDKASQEKAVEVSIDFLWDQFNVGKDTDNPNYLVKRNKSERR